MTKKTANQPRPENASSDEPIFFYGTKNKYGEFSQWYRSEFTVPCAEIRSLLGNSADLRLGQDQAQMTFCCAEQFMMYCKAVIFGDYQTADEIKHHEDPKTQKTLGGYVANFSDEEWNKFKFAIVEYANYSKFGQNPDLKALLLGTGDREIFEAASRDRIWGIGFSAQTARTMRSRKDWGQNLLGKALMSAREKLKSEEEAECVP
jgi:ribA/ribD-fused uncharacterized protein